ncbi:hypothetical protein [Streptomyces formicae]
MAINVPEVEGHPLQFGIAPDNTTQNTVHVYLKVGCLGTQVTVPAGTAKGNNVTFKSFGCWSAGQVWRRA